MLRIPSGICPIYKPIGMTSSFVVQHLRHVLEKELRARTSAPSSKEKRILLKIGHGGTLDPLAEGVLIVGIGSGTKLLENYLKCEKKYAAGAMLGIATDTLDCTGKVTQKSTHSHITDETLHKHIPSFVGYIMQSPPAFSAVHVDGKRSYDLARQGQTVQHKERSIFVKHIHLDSFTWPEFRITVECGGGCYIRSLIHDLGLACGSHAHMTSLKRLQQGNFNIEQSLHQKDWKFDTICQHIEDSSCKANIDCRIPAAEYFLR